MKFVSMSGSAAAWPECPEEPHGKPAAASLPTREPDSAWSEPQPNTLQRGAFLRDAFPRNAFHRNTDWEIDRALLLERSERRAWWVAISALTLAALGVAAVCVQGPLRRVVEIPIVVDRVTGEATIQQRLSEEERAGGRA